MFQNSCIFAFKSSCKNKQNFQTTKKNFVNFSNFMDKILKIKHIKMEDFLIDNEKLQQICRFYGLNMANFATKIGVKNQELYAISSLKQKEFSRPTMSAIAKFCPEVSPYWLITGEGSMLAGSIEQHNINGDNIGQQNNHTAGGSVLESQQATIRDQAETIKQLTLLLTKK